MADKYWIAAVLQSLEQSLTPVPHEVNELDWKASLSDHKDRLAEHLMAFIVLDQFSRNICRDTPRAFA